MLFLAVLSIWFTFLGAQAQHDGTPVGLGSAENNLVRALALQQFQGFWSSRQLCRLPGSRCQAH